MGQILEGGSVSAGSSSQGVFNLKAGANIAQNDLVELGPDGKCYTVGCTDYAAVNQVAYGTAQTTAATGMIVAQTQVVAAQTTAYYRQAVVQGVDGSIFTLTAAAGGGADLSLSKYSASGGLLSQVTISSTGTAFQSHHIHLLSNGNIAAVAVNPATSNIYYAVYSDNLIQIKSLTAIGELSANNYISSCVLSGGGFAVVYQQSGSLSLSRLSIIDNTGTITLSPTTIWTRTGTAADQYHRMRQLSDGNLVLAVSSTNSSGNIGLFHGIVTTAGVSVTSFTNLDVTSRSLIPEVSVMHGYYSVARPNGTNQLAFVFNNSGTLQGASFTGVTAASTALATKLVNDGTAFYLIWPRSSDSKEVLTKLPITGTGYVTTDITTTNPDSGNSIFTDYVDAFCENGLIVTVFQSDSGGNSRPVLLVYSVSAGALLSKAATLFGVAPGVTAGQYQRIIQGVDFSFIALYDYASTASTNLCVGKYANTAVIGVAQAAAAKDALVPVAGIAGGYAANYIKGSPSKQFDHSATNIYGNKGALMNYGVVFKGF